MYATRLWIYKSSLGDCSNDGISSRYDTVLLIHPKGEVEIDENNLPENLCKLVERNICGEVYKHIEPYAKTNGVGWMASGCIVDSSDSRFREISRYPLKLHDRTESKQKYLELCQ